MTGHARMRRRAGRGSPKLDRDERHLNDAVLDSLVDSVLTLDAEGTVLRVNRRWVTDSGFTAAETIGRRPPYPWWPPGDGEHRAVEMTRLLAEGSPAEIDTVICRSDGSRMDVQSTLRLVRDGGGAISAAVVTYRDLTGRKQAEAERHRAAEELNHFFTLSDDLLCVAAGDGSITRVNPAWEHVLGGRTADLVGRPFLTFVHPDDVAAVTDELRRLSAGAASVSFESRHRRRDGAVRRISWNAATAPPEKSIYAVGRDVTAQHEAEETRALLAAIVDGTADAVVSKDLDGTITSWNRAAERLYGYPAEEILGRPITVLYPPERLGELATSMARLAAGEAIEGQDGARLRKDGGMLHLSWTLSPLRAGNGAVIGSASIARDISQIVKAEERFRRLVLSAPESLIIADAGGVIRLVNEQTERLFGYTTEELVGRPVNQLVPPEFRDRHAAHQREFLAHPGIRVMGADLELSGLRKDGTRFPAEVTLAPLDTEDGMLVSAAVRDVTVRKRVEHDLAAARDEALAATSLKSQFVAMVSHEIRTPMNGVLGLTQLLLDTRLAPVQRRYAEAVRTSARALLTVINDILDFSKIEAGKVTLVDAEFDPGHLIAQVAQVAAEAARDKAVEVCNYYPPSLPTAVRGDSGRIRQVLLNLAGNAVKFTDSGTVSIQASPAPAGADGSQRYRFAVIDTGIGIDAAERTRLFEPFTQADGTASRRFGGTGLGLTISHQLVELLGGQLEVDSTPGRGSTFSFTIPLGAPDDGSAWYLIRDRLSGQRMLVVDDGPTGSQILVEHARSWGLQVSVAADPDSALERLRHAARQDHPFDIVLVNQRPSAPGGADLLARIAADGTIPTPALVVTLPDPYDQDRHPFDTGAVEVLAGPVGPSALYDCLLRQLDLDPADDALAADGPAETPATGRPTILVAEDNEINRLVAVDTLAMLGYLADVARDGVEAVDLAGTGQYAAILMDCQMPKLDGYGATRELRRRERPDRHIPVIAMTASALAEDKRRCLDAGMDDYLAKPIEPAALRAALTRWAGPGDDRTTGAVSRAGRADS
jgi:PAS domain S-box-containing protein